MVSGDDIVKYYEPKIKEKLASANFGDGEPLGFAVQNMSGSGGSNIVSEQFTFFNATQEDLSAKGNGGNRQMFNYTSVNSGDNFIETPPDTYRPDKVSVNVNMDTIQKQRNVDIQQSPLFIPSLP